jgi:hypothetical protein
MSDNGLRGLAPVIIPSRNQLEFARKCIAALFRKNAPGWELIVVNSGSTPSSRYGSGPIGRNDALKSLTQDANAFVGLSTALDSGWPADVTTLISGSEPCGRAFSGHWGGRRGDRPIVCAIRPARPGAPYQDEQTSR